MATKKKAAKKAAPKKATGKKSGGKKSAPKKAPAYMLSTADQAKVASCLRKSGKATIAIKEVAATKITAGGSRSVIIID